MNKLSESANARRIAEGKLNAEYGSSTDDISRPKPSENAMANYIDSSNEESKHIFLSDALGALTFAAAVTAIIIVGMGA